MKTGRPTKRKRTPLGERLYALRIAAGLSQAHMAKAFGLKQTAYSWWERRDVALRADQIEKLLELLDVTADKLFPRQPAPVGKQKKAPLRRAKS